MKEPEKSGHAFSRPVGRVSFRLEFYTDDSQWRGRIQHVLSRETAVFEPGDLATLTAFIGRHLPPLSDEGEVVKGGSESELRDAVPIDGGSGSLRIRFCVRSPGGYGVSHVVPHLSPFDLMYEVSSTEEEVWDRGLRCALEVYARPISGGRVWHLHSESRRLDEEGRRGVIHIACPAPAGNYQLELVARVMDKAGALLSVTGSWEGGLVVML